MTINVSYDIDNLTREQKQWVTAYLVSQHTTLLDITELGPAMAWHSLTNGEDLYNFLQNCMRPDMMICAATLRSLTRLPDDPQLKPTPHSAAPVRRPRTPEEAARNRVTPVAPGPGEVLTFLAANPKRKGSASYARYELYQLGLSRTQLLAAGLSTADIRWDQEHGYIRFGTATELDSEGAVDEQKEETDA